MDQDMQIAIAAAGAALALIVASLVFGMPFRLLHAWINFPVIGTVARLSRLKVPSDDEANKRLERIYRIYRARIADLLSLADFERIRRYLFLAGDSATRPVNFMVILGLALLIGAESFAFAFVLGGNVWAGASDDEVKLFAVLITAVLVLLLAMFGHVVGGMIRRTKALREAWPDALDKSQTLQGEKPMVDLVVRISVEEDQERDQPRREPIDAQRMLNRVATHKGDRGSYIWPAIYAIGVLGLAGLQFAMRSISNITASAASLPFESDLPASLTQTAQAGDTNFAANIVFVLIFLATQAYAVREGYVHAFLGIDSKRAYGMISGADSYEAVDSAYHARTRAADQSLANLLARFKRFDRLHPDPALYLERVARENAHEAGLAGDGGKDPPATAADDTNVTTLPLGGGGK